MGLALGLGGAVTGLGRAGDLENTAPQKTKNKGGFLDLDLEFLVLLVAFEYLELVFLHDCSELLAGTTPGRDGEWCNVIFSPFQIAPEQIQAPLAPYKAEAPQRHLKLGN